MPLQTNSLLISYSGTLQGPAGENGVTSIPSVSEDGVLSWTNDGELNNPTPVNIKGEKGDTGNTGANGTNGSDGATFTPSVSETGVLSWTNDKGLTNPEDVNLSNVVTFIIKKYNEVEST